MAHLTVACLNFNGADTLLDSVESVLEQTFKPNRFVVIDNASTDDSRQIAVDMGVKIIDADNKHRFITGLNAAMELNQDLLFFMQNDVILDKKCLEVMMETHPSSLLNRCSNFIAQPLIYQPDGKIDNAGMDIIWPGYGRRRITYHYWRGMHYEKCGLVTTICFLTDLKNHRYSEFFAPAYYEDLSFKLEYPGVSHYLIPLAKAVHKGNHSFSRTLKKREISEICRINRKKLIQRNYRGFDRMIRTSVLSVFDIAKKAFDVITDWRVTHNNIK